MSGQAVDLAPFLAAIVQEAGGEIQVGFDTINGLDPDQIALAIEPNDDQTKLRILLVPAGLAREDDEDE